MSQESNLMTCPKCAYEFSLTDQMSKEIEKDVERRYQKNLEREKVLLEAKIRDSMAKQMSLELKDLANQIKEKDEKIGTAEKNELELRKKTRELLAKEKQMELDTQRMLDAERSKFSESVRKQIADEFQLRLAQKDLQLEGLAKTIKELNSKAHQGSQQIQGEAMELEIETLLGARFPLDSIEPIAKGQRGADVLQIVFIDSGNEAGKILFESKNTKNWTDNWISKAKDDQREQKAEFVVIISESLPKEITGFGLYEGVWVTNLQNHLSLVEALRFHIIDVFHARNSATGKGEKLDSLYRYISETQFKQRIDGIIEAFRTMRESIEGEKRSMQRIWASREKCLERVISNTAAMYGDIQGIIGASLPKIETLELESAQLLESAENNEFFSES